jgi:hypothetical protein
VHICVTDMGKRARATFEETCRVTGRQDLKQIDSPGRGNLQWMGKPFSISLCCASLLPNLSGSHDWSVVSSPHVRFRNASDRSDFFM